ncbi:MAG TPA: hypothetical protein VL463_22110 [Kofleriaceae bacterium]|nr:hypothetical protein [Kofleriaceae bacterium]
MRRGALVLLCMVACATAKTGVGGDANGTGSGTDGGNGSGADAKPTAPDANNCAKQPCSLAPQCGCGSGSACQLDGSNLATGGTTCLAAGSGGDDVTCSDDSKCKAGHGCVGGRCRAWCGGDGDCTSGPGALCIIQVVYGSPQMDVPGAKVCTTDCDPSSKTPAGCPSTFGCHVYQESGGAMRYVTDCDPAGTVGAGGSCATNGSRDCQAGMDCINVTRSGVTTAECHPSCICPGNNCAAGSCPSGTGSCQAFNPIVTIGTREYGTCL